MGEAPLQWSATHTAPETVTQMVSVPWSADTGGFTGAFQPGPLAALQLVLQ
jgi:hypothetical protein